MINWIVALKAIPWADVVQAAPHIVKGARKLFTSVRGGTAEAGAGSDSAARSNGNRTGVGPRLAEIESMVDTLRAEQRATAELIRSLAEQNAKVVEAIEILRVRTRMLIAASVVSIVVLTMLVVWTVTR